MISKRGYLDRDIPSSFIDEWTEKYSTKIDDDSSNTESFVVFRISGQDIALNTKFLFESFLNIKKIHSVPGRTNKLFLGLANVNGSLVYVLNIAEILLSNVESPNLKQSMLFVGMKTIKFMFSIDKLLGEFKIKVNMIEKIPENIVNKPNSLYKRRFSLSDSTVLIIDEETFFNLIDEKLNW